MSFTTRNRKQTMAMDDLSIGGFILMWLGMWKAGELLGGAIVGLVRIAWAIRKFLQWVKEGKERPPSGVNVGQVQQMLTDVESEIKSRKSGAGRSKRGRGR